MGDQGIRVIKVDGTPEAVEIAKKLITEKMTEVNIKEGQQEQYSIRIEQHHVAMFVGRGGENIKQVKLRSGGDVLVDQSTKDMGYSTIRIGVGVGAEQAYKLVMEKIDEINTFKNKPSQLKRHMLQEQEKNRREAEMSRSSGAHFNGGIAMPSAPGSIDGGWGQQTNNDSWGQLTNSGSWGQQSNNAGFGHCNPTTGMDSNPMVLPIQQHSECPIKHRRCKGLLSCLCPMKLGTRRPFRINSILMCKLQCSLSKGSLKV